jgi:UDP-glucose 4-epimerase
MSQYLVTGGAGFIGSHLVESLIASGHKVTVLDDLSTGRLCNLPPEGFSFIEGNIIDFDTVYRACQRVDGIFHLAAIASVSKCNEEWVESHKTNLTGTLVVMDAARKLGGIPVVYASSAAVYGCQPNGAIREDAPCKPSSPYGVDKFACELHAKAAYIIHQLPTIGLRFFNVYGSRQDPTSPYSGVISIFADRLRKQLPLTIYGDGNQTRDFIHVSDIVRFLQQAMEKSNKEGEVFNACTGKASSLLELTSTLGDVLEIIPTLQFASVRLGDIKESLGDPSYAQKELRIKSSLSLKKGLTLSLL